MEQDSRLQIPSKLVVYEGLALTVEDGIRLSYLGELENTNACYVDEGFSIFYDMKRWISDYKRQEEITDRQGKRGYPLTMETEEILKKLDGDVYRLVDREGAATVYQPLEEVYHQAERFLPTRFRDYEAKSRSAYFQVKNNFYHLFFLAEQVKKSFFEQAGVLQVGITSEAQKDPGVRWVVADKWKLSIGKKEGLTVLKEFPRLVFNLYQVELLLKADIYNLIRKFMEPFYLEDNLRDFSFLKLTGQSCKIGLFREAMKEFIPGRMIQVQRKAKEGKGDIALKMSCVEGALNYIRDKRTGIARIDLFSDKPLLPYTVHTHTHRGKEVELVNGFLREEETRYVSRNLEEVTLNLYLKDASGKIRCHFAFDCEPNRFQDVTYEEIEAIHGKHILQKETDSIVNQEMRFFAWKRCRDWGYVIVPVYRKEEQLYLGEEQFYPFEHEGWVRNFFDGTW